MRKDILNETFQKHTFLLKKRLYEQGVIQQQPVQEENLDEDLKSIVTAGLLGLSSLFSKDKPTNNVTSTGTQTTAVATNTVGVTPISKDDLKKFDDLTYRSGLAIANYWLPVVKMCKEEGLPIPSLVNVKEDGARAAGDRLDQIKYLQDWAKYGKAGIMKADDYSSKLHPPEEISLARLIQKSIVGGEAQGGQFSSMYEDSQLGRETDEITEELITKIIKIKYPNFKPTDRNEDTDNVTTAVRNLKNLNIFHQYVGSAEKTISYFK